MSAARDFVEIVLACLQTLAGLDAGQLGILAQVGAFTMGLSIGLGMALTALILASFRRDQQ